MSEKEREKKAAGRAWRYKKSLPRICRDSFSLRYVQFFAVVKSTPEKNPHVCVLFKEKNFLS